MDVFQEFYAKLVEVLPMDDLCFIASLVVYRILSVESGCRVLSSVILTEHTSREGIISSGSRDMAISQQW